MRALTLLLCLSITDASAGAMARSQADADAALAATLRSAEGAVIGVVQSAWRHGGEIPESARSSSWTLRIGCWTSGRSEASACS